jgi:WD40 repeat protein
MADLFISYSRKDKSFVQKLQPALEAEGQSLWLDWKDIPLTADWRAEIRQGIQEADAVIFTMSPDFLESRECMIELEIAQEFNKRLIPLVYRDIKATAVPSALTSLNWIFFRENDDFDGALKALIQALRTDLGWVKAHTRLTIRAAEWDGKTRNDSFLLRGDDLEAAEGLLTQTKHQPELTPLQMEYILASRRSAVRRQRRILGAVTFGFIVALVLGVVAYLESVEAKRERDRASAAEIVAVEGQNAARTAEAEAETQRDIAQDARVTAVAGQELAVEAQGTAEVRRLEAVEAQGTAEARRLEAVEAQALAEARRLEAEKAARIARSGQLAAQAQAAILEDRPQRSLLLAAEAISASQELRLPNTETVLWQALANAGGRQLDNYEEAVTGFTLSPDSRWLVIASPSSVQAWDLNKPEQGATALPAPAGAAAVMAISPDNQWLVIANNSPTHLWDLADLTAEPVTPGGPQEAITALAISPDSRLLATGSVTGALQLWELADLDEPLVTLTSQENQNQIQSITFSPDNRWLVTVGNIENSARLWDLSNLAEVEVTILSPSTNQPIAGLALSPDSRWLAVGSDDTYLWDLSSSDLVTEPLVLPSQSFVNAITISADSRWLITGNEDSTVHLRNLAAPEAAPVVLRGHSQPITGVTISSDNRRLVTASRDHTSRVWDLKDPEAKPIILRGHDEAVTTLAISPDNHWLVTGSADKTVRLWDLFSSNLAAIAPIVLPDPEGDMIEAATLTPDGHQLITANDQGVIQVRDLSRTNGGTPEAPPLVSTLQSGHSGSITTLGISPNGRWLATGSNDMTARLWDLQQPIPVPFVLEGHSGTVTALAFTPDGRWLATSSDDATLRLWDLAASDPVAKPLVLTGHEGSISALAVSADNRWLISAGNDRIVRLWNLEHIANNPSPSMTLTGHEAWIRFAAISADNRWLVTVDDDGVARLWNLPPVEAQVNEAIVLPALPRNRVTALNFSPDSRWLAIAGLEGVTYLWQLADISNSAAAPFILRGHDNSVRDIAIDPGSRWLVTGSFDNTVRLWDLTAPDPAAASTLLLNSAGSVEGVEISPDVHWLVTRSDAGVSLWTLDLEEQIALACSAAGRNLTAEEWEQYFSGEKPHNIC